MPRIFDDIHDRVLETHRPTLAQSSRADFCDGCFKLRGWPVIEDMVDKWDAAAGQVCRVLVGVQRPSLVGIKTLCLLVGPAAADRDD